MRTTLDVENDVFDAAKALATARGVSVGAALSELARRGVAAAIAQEDLAAAREFLKPGK